MDDGRIQQFIQTTFRSVGRQYEEARQAYSDAKRSALADLPLDENGQAKLVCRRHAEKRTVALDQQGRPDCFDANHQDCRGCVEDIRDGVIETW